MKRKTAAKKTKPSPPRAKAKPKRAGKTASRKAAAKAPAATAPAGPPKAAIYTPKPIEGIGWAPFRYTR
jgi:hypothetical protein